MRVVAALAYEVQAAGYKKVTRSTIVRTWDELLALLPEDWPRERRTRFLSWLVGRAALLVDRADGTLAFTHLSFQEFLAAWHLNASTEGSERAETFARHLDDTNWWETLLLWAALIERQSRDRLEGVIRALDEHGDAGLAVKGMMLADGLGLEPSFHDWKRQLVRALNDHWPREIERCARAWAGSRQEERRQSLAAELEDAAKSSRWILWIRLRELGKEAALVDGLKPSESNSTTRELCTLELGGKVDSQAAVAAGRVLCGGLPVWPTAPLEVGLFQVWPGHRRFAGLRLQTAMTCGAPLEDILQTARSVLIAPTWDEKARDVARDAALDVARDWKLDESLWLQDFSLFELTSFGRGSARSSLAHKDLSRSSREAQLLAAACRRSLHPESTPDELQEILENHESHCDPLWPALARHLARCSTDADRELLEDLAQHPEKCEAPLSWGLRFIVRGDVMLADGRVVTLDELCDELGLPCLPYLEDLPDEIELPDEE